MKLSLAKTILALALAAGGALAQSSNNVPGAADYAAFSRFVTDRNIFDPNRVPHSTSSKPRNNTRTRTRTSPSAPAFTLVGTMAYDKGLYAFFSGNSDELKQTLKTSGKIAGYTVAEISRDRAVLVSADQKEKLELKVGDVVRQENGKWQQSGPGEVPAAAGTAKSAAAPSDPPPSAAASNDVLKRLMQLREQENK